MPPVAPMLARPARELPAGGWCYEPASSGRLAPTPSSSPTHSADRDLRFELLRPERVVEAAYEHLQGDRQRHTARFRRWRPDRRPEECTYSRLEVAVPALLEEVFAARG